MDALIYFFGNLGLLNLFLALASFLLGLILGWFAWGRLAGAHKNCSSGLDAAKSRIKTLEAQIASQKSGDDSTALKAKLDACGDANIDLEAQLEACKKSRLDLEAKVSSLEGDLGSASANKGSITPATNDSALREKNMNFFEDEIKSGKIRKDETYGLLYNEKPDEVDDLTRIKGVAGVLNKTLNDYGVFKYRQIALWSPQICEDFSEKIAFKGRVERDNWIDQCKQFHEEKYGEKI